MSGIDSSSEQNADDSGTTGVEGGRFGQKRLINLLFLVIVLLLSLLVLVLVVFDQESSSAENQNRTWQREKTGIREVQYRFSTKDEDRYHFSSRNVHITEQKPFGNGGDVA